MFKRRPKTLAFGELEQAIMDVCWKHEKTTVREVFEVINRHRRLAYTTVMTIMNRLVEKGHLRRRADGNCFCYFTEYTREEFQAKSSKRIINELLTEYGDVAIAQFLATLGTVDREKLRQFKQALRKGRKA